MNIIKEVIDTVNKKYFTIGSIEHLFNEVFNTFKQIKKLETIYRKKTAKSIKIREQEQKVQNAGYFIRKAKHKIKIQ